MHCVVVEDLKKEIVPPRELFREISERNECIQCSFLVFLCTRYNIFYDTWTEKKNLIVCSFLFVGSSEQFSKKKSFFSALFNEMNLESLIKYFSSV